MRHRLAGLEIRKIISAASRGDCLVREFVHQRQIRCGIGKEKIILRDPFRNVRIC